MTTYGSAAPANRSIVAAASAYTPNRGGASMATYAHGFAYGEELHEDDYPNGVADGKADGFRRGMGVGMQRGEQAQAETISSAASAALRTGIAIGRVTAPVFTANEDAPEITFVSPTPGVAPGAVGGFPADPSAAKNTPIVIQLADTDPGLRYVCVGVRYTDEDGNEIEETIYRRSNFRGLYVDGSKQEMVGDALQLTMKREGGWLALIQGASNQFEFFADVVDMAGNVNEEE